MARHRLFIDVARVANHVNHTGCGEGVEDRRGELLDMAELIAPARLAHAFSMVGVKEAEKPRVGRRALRKLGADAC